VYTHTHTHTHPFNCPFSGTTRVGRYQKGRTNLDFTEARDSEWQWHQLGRMQVCTSLQADNHANTPPLSFFTGRMPFLPPNQQRQSIEGKPQVHMRIKQYLGPAIKKLINIIIQHARTTNKVSCLGMSMISCALNAYSGRLADMPMD